MMLNNIIDQDFIEIFCLFLAFVDLKDSVVGDSLQVLSILYLGHVAQPSFCLFMSMQTLLLFLSEYLRKN